MASAAKLLFSLGVQRHPSLETLLPLAAHPTDISLRSSSLEYFFSHFYEVYKDMYLVSSVARSVAFVPSIRGSDATAFLATPSETFTNGECAVLGFNVVASSARVEAIQKLKILSDPPAALLAETLVAKPPRDQESARKIFEACIMTSFGPLLAALTTVSAVPRLAHLQFQLLRHQPATNHPHCPRHQDWQGCANAPSL